MAALPRRDLAFKGVRVDLMLVAPDVVQEVVQVCCGDGEEDLD
jgi:hypothetical protein